METKLFMKRALANSFRRYTLVAENMIAASTAEAQLVHGTRIPPPRNCVGFTNQANSKTNMITEFTATERLKYLKKIHDVRCVEQQMWELWILAWYSVIT